MSCYVLINFPEEATPYYTNWWFIDNTDNWTNTQVLEDICLVGELDALDYKLQRDGIDIVPEELAKDTFSTNDIVDVILK